MKKILIAVFPLVLAGCVDVQAQDLIAEGHALVVENCSGCHAISGNDVSLHVHAPAFRDLEGRFPLDALEDTFVGTIDTGHPGMPVFTASQHQIDAIIAYIASVME
jgi:cytochrome c